MPGFLGGLAQGLQGGGFDQALDYFLKERQLKRTAAAMANANGGPPPAAPGGGRPDPMRALAALGGRPQAPAPGPGGPAPQPAAAPAPQPMPGQPTGRPGAEAPTGMAVDPGVADPTKEAQSLIMNLWQTTKAANPKADPLTLMDAVHAQIEDIKGVATITKATMQGQLMYMKELSLDQYRQARLQQYDHDWMIKYQNAKTAEERVRLNSEYQSGRLKIMQEHEDSYATSVANIHEDRRAAEAGRNARNTANIDSKMSVAELKEQGLDDRSAAAIKGRHGAAIAAGVARVMSYQPGADLNSVVAGLNAAYGEDSGGAAKPSPQAGGIPPKVQQFAKQHGLTIIRKRADGKYDAKDKNGTPGVIG